MEAKANPVVKCDQSDPDFVTMATRDELPKLVAAWSAAVITPRRKKRKEKTTPFGGNLMRSQVLYWAAQTPRGNYVGDPWGCNSVHSVPCSQA